MLAVVTSDKGVQFTSAFWAVMTRRLGIRHKLTTAFHPQVNGAVECFHRKLKDALQAWLAGNGWFSHLPWVMLGLRAVPREDSGISAAKIVFGMLLMLPGPILTTAKPLPEVFVKLVFLVWLRCQITCMLPRPQRLQHLLFSLLPMCPSMHLQR
jgi:hypothetical protein